MQRHAAGTPRLEVVGTTCGKVGHQTHICRPTFLHLGSCLQHAHPASVDSRSAPSFPHVTLSTATPRGGAYPWKDRAIKKHVTLSTAKPLRASYPEIDLGAGSFDPKKRRSFVAPASRRRGGVRCRRDARTTKHRSSYVIGSERVRRVSRRVPPRTGARLSFPSPIRVGATNTSNEIHDGRDRQKEALQ